MAVQNSFGAYLPLVQAFDPDSLAKLENLDPALKSLVITAYQNYNNTATIVNLKETGYYLTTEIVNSQLWFTSSGGSTSDTRFRNAFRTVVNFGALPNAGTKTVAHNIPNLIAGTVSWTKIYGTATNTSGEGIPLPYASPTLNQNISLRVDTTNVYVTTAIDYSAYTVTYIVLEYLRN
jgi:hypothetical protein